MVKVNVYLNFAGGTEEAFAFYRSVFGGEIREFRRFGDIPGMTGTPEELRRVMHIELPIGDQFVLMASDTPAADPVSGQGYRLHAGNTVYLSLHPDSQAEARRVFDALSAGGVIESELVPMFWGSLYASFADRFGVQWMIDCPLTHPPQ